MGTKLRAGNGNNNSLCVLFGSHCVGGGIIPLRVSLLGVDGWVLFLGCFGLGRRGGGDSRVSVRVTGMLSDISWFSKIF